MVCNPRSWMIYRVRCDTCGIQEFEESIETVSFPRPCPACGALSPKLFESPKFVEDRLRFFKGHDGTGYSFALGERMPDSRAARDRLAKQKGIYFDSQLTKDEQRYRDYGKHVASGGERIEPKQLLPKEPDTSKELSAKIMHTWRKDGI